MKLITLNIEGDRHLSRVLPFLQQENADIVCLQEVFEVDVPTISAHLKMQAYFVPMARMEEENPYYKSLKGVWGIALLTKHEPLMIKKQYYRGTGTTPLFHHPYDNDHAIIISTIQEGEKIFTIATTHFTWSPKGEISPEQESSFAELEAILNQYPDLVLCGDLNAPRGRDVFAMFEQTLTDALPKQYTTTLDKQFHYAGELHLVVDTIFTKGKYIAHDVHLVDGISDHMAVVGEIEEKR